MDADYVQEGKGIAWISYLGILVIIPILLQKDNPYTKYHIKQGIALLIVSVIWNIVWIIPFVGFVLGTVGWVILLVFMVLGIVNALNGKEKPLPLICKIAEQIKF